MKEMICDIGYKIFMLIIFFFSSRRRHTRSYGDWSSDVCSSDLGAARGEADPGGGRLLGARREPRLALVAENAPVSPRTPEIGRASCRERVEIAVGAGEVKEKYHTMDVHYIR